MGVSLKMEDPARQLGGLSVRQSIVEALEAQRLADVRTKIWLILRRSDEFIKDKNKDDGVAAPLTSYRDSIDDAIF